MGSVARSLPQVNKYNYQIDGELNYMPAPAIHSAREDVTGREHILRGRGRDMLLRAL